MLVIGHRGAAGQKPENTLAGIREARRCGADMVECDVRLTRDKVPVLCHDDSLKRTHGLSLKIKDTTLKQLQKRTSGGEAPICTLEEVFADSLGKIMINVELKDKHSGLATLELLRKPKFKEHLDKVLLTSFSARELVRVRNLNKKVQLGLLMRLNPFAFLAWERKLHLSAVGFHRLHLNRLAIESAHQLKIFVFVYTVNRKNALKHLRKQGIDGVVTDFPADFIKKISKSSRVNG